MIDIDKYEGHTKGPWELEPDGINRLIFFNDEYESWGQLTKGADLALLSDAPLLLAEVKRLREGINEVMNECWPNATKMMKRIMEMVE